jgi:hypothetical protein
MPRKMMPPLPESGESDHDRFVNFAKAVLTVSKSEVGAHQEARMQEIDSKLVDVQRGLTKRRTARRRRPS